MKQRLQHGVLLLVAGALAALSTGCIAGDADPDEDGEETEEAEAAASLVVNGSAAEMKPWSPAAGKPARAATRLSEADVREAGDARDEEVEDDREESSGPTPEPWKNAW